MYIIKKQNNCKTNYNNVRNVRFYSKIVQFFLMLITSISSFLDILQSIEQCFTSFYSLLCVLKENYAPFCAFYILQKKMTLSRAQGTALLRAIRILLNSIRLCRCLRTSLIQNFDSFDCNSGNCNGNCNGNCSSNNLCFCSTIILLCVVRIVYYIILFHDRYIIIFYDRTLLFFKLRGKLR